MRRIIEFRQYALQIGSALKYINATRQNASLRKELFPLRLFSLPETGGQLNLATHLYSYESMEERDHKRQSSANNEEWKQYLSIVRPMMLKQQSNIFVEPPLVENFNLHSLIPNDTTNVTDASHMNNKCIYEFRKYNLKLGYDTVPKFLEYYETGLPSKLETLDDCTSLISIFYTEIGELNEVYEIWRHGNGVNGMEVSRNNAREANEWRAAIGNIATLANTFQSTIHKPVDFSNYQ